jgi:hypothetical protein
MASAPQSPYELEEGGIQEDEVRAPESRSSTSRAADRRLVLARCSQGPQLPTPWALYKLQQAATLALRLLADLTDTAIVGPDSIRLPAMPKSALLHTQARRRAAHAADACTVAAAAAARRRPAAGHHSAPRHAHPALPRPAPPFPGDPSAQGLACIYRRKAGLLLSRTKAQGFIIKRIVQPDGTSTWSAPVFVRGRGYGLGLTVGASRRHRYVAVW